MVDIAKAIRVARAERKWTQQDLAERLGCSQNTISQWERLDSPAIPSGSHIIKICELFGLDIRDFPKNEGKGK